MIKLYDRLIELYKNDKSQLSSILGLFYNIDIDLQIINKSKNKKLIFKYQDGGKIKSYNFENNNYYYNVEYAKSTKDNSINEVYLITINDGTVGCGLILIDNKTVTKNLIILDNPLLEVILRFILKTYINVLDFIT